MKRFPFLALLLLPFVGAPQVRAMEPEPLRTRIAGIKSQLRFEEALKQLGLIKESWKELGDDRISADQELGTGFWSIRIDEPGPVKAVNVMTEALKDMSPKLLKVTAIEIYKETGKESDKEPEVYYFTDGKYVLGVRKKPVKEEGK